MEDAPENGKESSHPAHANGMNGIPPVQPTEDEPLGLKHVEDIVKFKIVF